MCGIAGLVDFSPERHAGDLSGPVAAMTAALAHRGPDAGRRWIDQEAGVGFGHRRLAIVDLTPGGAQPMASADGRWVVTYNGEIYNFQALRAELAAAGCQFRSQSDTEVLIEAIASWGVATAARRLIGIFACAVWDRGRRQLSLIRDPLGVKPLYWSESRGVVRFGSELKALRACGGWTAEVDRAAMTAYLRLGYVPAPHTIYRGVHKLEAGTVLTLGAGAAPRSDRYWDLRAVATGPRRSPYSDAEAITDLEALLSDAVGRQMVADVPLGAFLSGGIDSSTVVALMQAQSPRPVRTFSIGFREGGYDEAGHAAAVARHLGTDHTELYVEPHHALDVIPNLANWYDEPFADNSQIPTYLVSALARRHVTVALSGDGGDELFAGYNRYFWADRLWRGVSSVPPFARRLAAAGLRAVGPGVWNRAFSPLPSRLCPRQIGDKLHKVAAILGVDGADAIYRRLISQWPDPSSLARGEIEADSVLWDRSVATDIPDFVERMQYFDAAMYLPDDILVKVDRASMAVALEARVPLLDHRVAAFAATLPRHMKIRNGTSKWLLRQVLHRHVPQALVERPKMGFSVPIDSWLRGPLRDWAETLLDERTIRDQGFLDPVPVRRLWEAHLSRDLNGQYPLWVVLMFQMWHQRWMQPAGVTVRYDEAAAGAAASSTIALPAYA
ncbi:MAG: asparagine synthase (glutamine-hydrolyzing) [Azospirillaceae bacterium]|nr:asparagine synthase (glutamine-hydrolyzing) [Azospirillaceae bacterium]